MNSEALDITVIVRTSGRPRCYLERAMASIRGQTRRPVRVIVSDDSGGEAGTVDCGAPVEWLLRPSGEAQSRSRALNRAISHATTLWVAFLDDDDTWRPDFLERMAMDAVAKSACSDVGAICCRTEARYEDEREGVFVELGREPFNPCFTAVKLADLVEGNLFTNNGVLWRRVVFAEVGGFRDDIAVLEDWEFNVRARRRFEMAVLPLTLACYHQRPLLHGRQEANSSKAEHDVVLAQLAKEWLAAGLVPPDRGLHWLRNRWRAMRHQWARRRFAARWRGGT